MSAHSTYCSPECEVLSMVARTNMCSHKCICVCANKRANRFERFQGVISVSLAVINILTIFLVLLGTAHLALIFAISSISALLFANADALSSIACSGILWSGCPPRRRTRQIQFQKLVQHDDEVRRPGPPARLSLGREPEAILIQCCQSAHKLLCSFCTQLIMCVSSNIGAEEPHWAPRPTLAATTLGAGTVALPRAAKSATAKLCRTILTRSTTGREISPIYRCDSSFNVS